jgi:hypothetical protein
MVLGCTLCFGLRPGGWRWRLSSLVDDLNALLVKERGVVEATAALIDELDPTDPDIAGSAGDVQETASWVCEGLCHRINQLGGSASLESYGLAQVVTDEQDTPKKIKLICRCEEEAARMVKAILKRADIDEDTQGFLEDVMNARRSSVFWCESTLSQWKVDK